MTSNPNTVGRVQANLYVLGSQTSAVSFTAFGPEQVVQTTLTTGSFDAPVDQPFSVRLTLRGSSYVIDNNSDPETASNMTDFGGTMNFTTGGTVFDLPSGYTANSIDGQIVDNLFVGAQVPALSPPAAAGLISLLVVFGEGLLRRRSA